MYKRTMQHWARVFSRQLKRGQPYREITKTITVNILNYCHFKQAFPHHIPFYRFSPTANILLTDVMEIHYFELPKLMDKWKKGMIHLQEDKSAQWLLLLMADDHDNLYRELEVCAMKDPIMKEALDIWDESSMDDATWFATEGMRRKHWDDVSRQAWIEELEKEAEQAKATAEQAKAAAEQAKAAAEQAKAAAELVKKEAQVKIATALLKAGLDVEAAAKEAGLPVESVQKMREDMQF